MTALNNETSREDVLSKLYYSGLLTRIVFIFDPPVHDGDLDMDIDDDDFDSDFNRLMV
jgi:hypothetical protein